MSGAFLLGRDAFFTAFDAKGFDKRVVRRSLAALRHSAWTSNELLDNWHIYVASKNHWRVRRHVFLGSHSPGYPRTLAAAPGQG